jgi:hypothetical protein
MTHLLMVQGGIEEGLTAIGYQLSVELSLLLTPYSSLLTPYSSLMFHHNGRRPVSSGGQVGGVQGEIAGRLPAIGWVPGEIGAR